MSDPSTPAGSILVVDDDPLMRRTIARVLTQHELATAGSAAEARTLLAGRVFDLVLLDVGMPDVDGIAFFRELGRSDPAVAARVAFLTGGSVTEEVTSFLDRVDNEVIEKPFTPSELRRAVDRCLASFD